MPYDTPTCERYRDELDAMMVVNSWIGRLVRESRAADPDNPVRVEWVPGSSPARHHGEPKVASLYRGSALIAAAAVWRDDMKATRLMRWVAAP